MLCQDYELIEIPIDVYSRVLCYPYGEQKLCMDRIESIKGIGIEAIYSFGKTKISKYNIVGKGHAAIVVLAKHKLYGVIALKIRRVDSKRLSLVDEAKFLKAIQPYGYAPKVYLYTDDFIVREYIDGLTVEEFLEIAYDRNNVATLVKNLILAAYKLDQLNIDVNEISRPYKQVVLLCGNPSKPFFIDLESGRYHLESSNVTKIINFIVSGGIENSIRDILGLGRDRIELIIKYAKLYREKLYSNRDDIVNKIISLIDN